VIIFADTEEKRNKGLMFLKEIDKNECALFVFEEGANPNFWNKNVNFDIDVAFFDSNKKLIEIKKLKAHQEKSTGRVRGTKYVIETNSDWFKDNNINIETSMHEILNKESIEKYEL
jgi:uncharacterized membrane protein (UPF0127 family)